MKRNIPLLMLLTILIVSKLYAQNDCVHGVSTNPAAPTNNSLPSSTGTSFLNSFDWMRLQDNGTLAPYQLTNMQYEQTMQNIYSNQVLDYYKYLSDDEQPIYQNGWELLLLNIGTYPNGSNNPNVDFSDIPYIVLYNRYRSIIRLYANYGAGYLPTGISIDAVKVVLSFYDSNKLSGTLRLNKGYDQPLDQNTSITKVVGIAKHPNQPNRWFSTDFQVAFDPCVCNHPSKLKLNFQFTTSEDLKLHGRGIAVNEDLITGNSALTKDYLSGFDYTGETAEGGVLMYKTLNKLVDDYLAKMDKYLQDAAIANEHNATIKRNKAIVNAFKSIVLNGVDNGISAVANMPWFDDFIAYANNMVGSNALIKKDIVEEAKKALSKEVNTFFANNFSEMPTPTTPSMPSATFSEMHFEGKINSSTDISGPTFYTPGTYGSTGTGSPQLSSVFEYPVYNESLGIFALLESPKILKSEVIKNISDISVSTNNGSNSNIPGVQQMWTRGFQFQLKDNLKYAFNSKLDIKSYKISAAFAFSTTTKFLGTVNSYLIQAYNDPLNTENVTSSNIDVNQYYGIKNNSIAYADLNVGAAEPDRNINPKYETSYIPIDAFKSLVVGMGLKNKYIHFWARPPYYKVTPSLHGYNLQFDDIELKLLVEVEYNMSRSDGKKNEMTYVFTYKIRPQDIISSSSEIVSDLENSAKNISKYAEDLLFKDVNFNGTAVNGCTLSGTTYTCKAWNNITLDGNIQVTSSYLVKMIAGNEIIINNSGLPATLELYPQSVLDYSQPMPQATSSYVQNFCNTTYAAKSPSAGGLIVQKENDREVATDENEVRRLNFAIAPNPNNGNFTVSVSNSIFKNEDKQTGKISVYNALGALVYQLDGLIDGNYDIDISNENAGIYMVKLQTSNGDVKTLKIVKQ